MTYIKRLFHLDLGGTSRKLTKSKQFFADFGEIRTTAPQPRHNAAMVSREPAATKNEGKTMIFAALILGTAFGSVSFVAALAFFEFGFLAALALYSLVGLSTVGLAICWFALRDHFSDHGETSQSKVTA